MKANKELPEQKITNYSIAATVYRNINRPLVDKLFLIKEKTSNPQKKRSLDYKARQIWRSVIKHSNTL